MNEQVLLLVEVLEEQGTQLKVRSFLEDGAAFEIAVNKHDVTRIPKSDDPKIHADRGWLNVEYSGENNQRANITLPSPALHLGHRVTVLTERLKRPEAPKAKQNVKDLYKIVEYPGEINAEAAAEKQVVKEEALAEQQQEEKNLAKE